MRTPSWGLWAALATVFFGTGLGLALAGRPRAALAWFGVIVIATCALVVTPWVAVGVLAIHFGSAIHAYLCASRSEQLKFHWAVGAIAGGALVAAVLIRAVVVEAFKIPSSAMYPTLQIGDHVFVDKLSPHWHAIERGEVIVFTYPCDHQRDYIKRVVAIGGDTVEVRCNVVYVNGKAVPSTLVAGECAYEDYDERDRSWFRRPCSRYTEVLDGHSYDTFHDPDRPQRDKRVATASEGDARDFPALDRPAPSCKNTEDAIGQADQALGTLSESKPIDLVCAPQLHFVVPGDDVFVLGDNRYNSNDSRVWGTVARSLVKGRLVGIWYSSGAHGTDWSRFGNVR